MDSTASQKELPILNQFAQHPLPVLLFVATACWVMVIAFFAFLNFDFMVSDVALYWRESEALINASFDLSVIYTEFHHDHVPGYNLLIAVGHTIFNFAGPVVVMQAINLIAWLLSITCVYYIFKTMELSYAWVGALIFAVFPLVGVSYAVYPIADSLAMLAVVAAVLGYMDDRNVLLAVAFACGPFIHKATWPILGLILIIGLWKRRIPVWMILPLGIPMLIYWLFGIQYTENFFWILGRYPDMIDSRTALPIFDGLFGPILAGEGLRGYVKSIIVIGVYGLGVWMMASGVWRREPVMLALLLPTLIWGAFYTAELIWPVVRFGKLFIIPLWLYLHHTVFTEQNASLTFIKRPLVWLTVLILMLLSQFAWTYYMSEAFFA